MGTEKEITNTSTGVTPEDLGGSGPSTDLNTKDFPPGTTSVDNGVPSNIDTLHRLGKVAKAPAEEDPYAEFGGSITKPQPQPQAAAAAPAKEEDPYAEFGGSITHQTEEEKRAALQT